MDYRAIPTRHRPTAAEGKEGRVIQPDDDDDDETQEKWTGLVVSFLILVLQRTIFEEHHHIFFDVLTNGTGTVRDTGT